MNIRLWQRLIGLVVLLALLAACGTTSAPPASAPASAAAEASPSAEPSVAASPDATETTAPASAEPSASAAASAPAEPSAAPSEAANVDEPVEYGAVATLYYTDAARVVTLADIAGFEWIRQQVAWKDTETEDRTFGFAELDKVVETVAAGNKKLLLSVVKSPDWATGRPGDNGLPENPDDFARFAEELARRYQGKVQAIEVWNEQNYATENGGRVTTDDAARYVELIKAAYPRIKAVDPSITVVSGALTSTGVTEVNTAVDDITYLRAMLDYNNGEIGNYMDALGFHPAATLNPPDTLYPDQPGPGCDVTPLQWCDSPTHYFRHIENVRAVMVEYGLEDKPIWITEMGWATENNSPGYEYGNQISYERQAEFLENALFQIEANYSDFVDVAFIWNLNFAVTWGQAGNPMHEQASFGLLNPDYSPRPSFTAIQGFLYARRQGQ